MDLAVLYSETLKAAVGSTGCLKDFNQDLTVAITPTQAPSKVRFSVSQAAILSGESATLTRETSDAETCMIDHGIGSVPLTGSTTLSPADTITYTLTATGPGGTATAKDAARVKEALRGFFVQR
jgi:hypothetical protein